MNLAESVGPHAVRGPTRTIGFIIAVIIAISGLLAANTARAETVTTGVLGSYASGVWPFVIAMKKGMFTKRDLDMDVIFVDTASSLIQQLVAGSLDFVAGVGTVEPLHSVEKGAPVALMRIVGQSPSYELVGNKNFTNISQLRGKKIAVGGLATNDKIYLDRMMAANGFKIGDYDIISIGATASRVPALLSGGIDAALLVPPFNFTALSQGGHSLGLVRDFVKDLPQTGMVVATKWALAHPHETKAINDALDEAVAWFYESKNRNEAIAIMAEATKTNPQEVGDAYDFLIKVDFFARTSEIQRSALNNWMNALVEVKDMQSVIPVDSVLVPGLNKVID